MKRFLAVAVLAALSSAALAQQVKNPLSTAIREVLANRQKNILAAVDTMPADKFSYKPSADQMTFGHLVLHIIESNHRFCAQAADVPEPKVAEVKDTDGKDKLTVALKESFDFCSSALEKTDDSKLGDSIDGFGKKEPRAWAFLILAGGWADHYGAAAMYLRQNGLLPPTAQKK
jgi:uncharacterized damage-inducible protein DinB